MQKRGVVATLWGKNWLPSFAASLTACSSIQQGGNFRLSIEYAFMRSLVFATYERLSGPNGYNPFVAGAMASGLISAAFYPSQLAKTMLLTGGTLVTLMRDIDRAQM